MERPRGFYSISKADTGCKVAQASLPGKAIKAEASSPKGTKLSAVVLLLLVAQAFASPLNPSNGAGGQPSSTTTCPNVTFLESGLAPGLPWYVQLGSESNSSTSTAVSFCAGPGNQSYSVDTLLQYEPSKLAYEALPPNGTLTAGSTPVTVAVKFVYVGPTLQIVSGAGAFSGVSPHNKSISAAPGEQLAGSLGLVENNRFSHYTSLIGTPSWGNPGGSFWQAQAPVPNGTTSLSIRVSLVAPAETGMYYLIFAFLDDSPGGLASFRAFDLPPSWAPGSGLAAMNGSQVAWAQADGYDPEEILANASSGSHYLTFMAVDVVGVMVGTGYPVTFSEEGLASGTPWWVTLDGQSHLSLTGSAMFLETNGTHTFRAGSVDGYSATPASGAVTVRGGPAAAAVDFVQNGTVRMAPRIQGPLHTEGTQIVDSSGKPVRLLGMGIGALCCGNGYPLTNDSCGSGPPASLAIVQKGYVNLTEWGFNSVRLQIEWADLEPLPPTTEPNGTVIHHWNGYYLREMDDVIGNFTSNGIAVIIGMQAGFLSPAFKDTPVGCEGVGMPSWLYPDAPALERRYGVSDFGAAWYGQCAFLANLAEPGVATKPLDGFKAAWSLVASRYAGNDLVVGADVLNEFYFTPFQQCQEYTGVSADYTLHTFYTSLGDVIREADPSLLLIFEGGPADPTEATNVQGPFPPNSVYSFHYYPPSWNAQLFDYQVAFARSLGVPVWIGEWNFKFTDGAAHSPDPNWVNDSKSLMLAAEQQGVSWAYEGYDYYDQGASGVAWFGPPGGDALNYSPQTAALIRQGLSDGYYNLTATLVGAAPGSAWTFDLGGWSRSSATASISFPALNGTYSYAATVGGRVTNGTFEVEGSDADLTLHAAGPPTSAVYAALPYVTAVSVAAVLAGAYMVKRRGRRAGAPSRVDFDEA